MDNKFEFSYSAPTQEERREIEYIQNKYKPKDKNLSKIEYLRKLDGKVKNIPTTVALILGILGTLIFGTGLTMILEWNLLIYGIIVCLVGCLPMIFAYFSYNKLSVKLKNKYSEEILKISSELLNDGK